jgi:hypothetical protein
MILMPYWTRTNPAICSSAFSNKSWSIASKEIFPLEEVNEMEMEMLECLDFRIGEEGVSSIVELIEGYELQYNRWEEDFKHGLASLKSLFSLEIQSQETAEKKSPRSVHWAEDVSDSRRSSMTLSTPSPSSTSSSVSSSHSSTHSHKSKKGSHSIWNHLRPGCKKHQNLSNFGNLISI